MKNDIILLERAFLHYVEAKISNDNGNCYCLNCLHSFKTENILKDHRKICKNQDYCYMEIPKNLGTKIN